MNADIRVLGSINCTGTCFARKVFVIVPFGLSNTLFYPDYIRTLSYLVYSFVIATFHPKFF